MNETLRLYKKFIPFVKPYWKRAVISLGLAVPIGCLDAVIAFSLKPYMDIVLLEKNMNSPFYIPFLIVLFTSLQGFLNYASSYLNDWVTFNVTNSIKMALFNKLMHKKSSFFDIKTSGDIQKRFNNDAQSACNGLLGNFKMIISRIFSSFSLIVVLIYNSRILSIIAISVLLCAISPLSKIKSKIKSVTNKSESENAIIITSYNETYNGNKVIKAYNLYDIQNKKFYTQLKKLFSLKIKITQRTGSISPIMHIIVSIGIALVIGIGSFLITNGQISAGSFVSFITALIMLYTPIKGLGNNIKSMQTALLAMERVCNNLEETDETKGEENAAYLDEFNSIITFEHVCFEYTKDTPVLKDINLNIKKGETLALVGNSGGGKSTIVSLLPRFYDVTEGEIKIDGKNIKNYTLNSLRENIAVVFQDNFLFSGTIRENILLGKQNATEKEILLSLKTAYLDEFVNTLENGIDTYIGERGVLLSGGQKQRIAIARAFIKNAPIIILDEATSALDNKSEAIVQKAIDNLMQDKTVFVIAHRLSTIKNADRIAVIDEGKLVELGSHDELMNIKDGSYKKLYEMQFAKNN